VVPETVKLEGGDGDREIERERKKGTNNRLSNRRSVSRLCSVSRCVYTSLVSQRKEAE
jgi:hypothetical protein